MEDGVVRAPTDDPRLLAVLSHVGGSVDQVLGRGGEAWVFGIDAERVVRIPHGATDASGVRERAVLLDELRQTSPTPLPQVFEAGDVDGRSFTIERRFDGRSVDDELGRLDGDERDRLIVAMLDAVTDLGAIELTRPGWFGDLIGARPVRTITWRQFLRDRISGSLRRAPGFEQIHADELVDDLPASEDPAASGFLHLDAFAGNVMADRATVTAIIDIGPTSAIGDPRLDRVASVVYLCAPEITPAAGPRDHAVSRAWLREVGLAEWEDPVRRWLAAYWAWAVDDEVLHRWCRSVLL